MKPPRRKIFLMGLFTPIIFYAASVVTLQKVSQERSLRNNEAQDWGRSSRGAKYYTRKQKIVILYSNQRSGSTFMGELFNRNKNAFYLYEPLFPFTPHCDFLTQERVDALENMLRCDFSHNSETFKTAQAVTNFGDSFSNCIPNSVCFASQSETLLRKYPIFCKHLSPSVEEPACHFPLQSNILSGLCFNSKLIAFKVLRVCSLEAVDDLYKRLKSNGKDVHVVHLVRDPRAIISSKLKLELKEEDTLQRAKELCSRLDGNLKYIENSTARPALVRDKKYLRVRYEDAATNPIGTAVVVYRFLGLALPNEVRNWLNTSTLMPRRKLAQIQNGLKTSQTDKGSLLTQYVGLMKKMKNPYGTVKDPSVTIQKWRVHLHFETVKDIQEICLNVLKHLKYKLLNQQHELADLSDKLW